MALFEKKIALINENDAKTVLETALEINDLSLPASENLALHTIEDEH